MKKKIDKTIEQRIKDKETLDFLCKGITLHNYNVRAVFKKTGEMLTKTEAHVIAKTLNYGVRTVKYTNKILKINTLFT